MVLSYPFFLPACSLFLSFQIEDFKTSITRLTKTKKKSGHRVTKGIIMMLGNIFVFPSCTKKTQFL